MKIRNLIMSLLAVSALAVVGCQEEEKDLGLPEVKVGTTQLSFNSGIGTNTVTVNATRDWKAVATVDWIDVSPKSGVGYENAVVNISVLENEGYNRTGSVRIDIGYDYKTILVHQEGPLGEKTEGTGTLEDPFTPAGAAEAASALAADEEAGPYYIKGIITNISTTFEASGTYGNASFFISEDGTENTKSFQVYQTYYLGNKKWTSSLGPDVKVGDEVIIHGKITNFKGNTPETVGKGGSYIYSLNGETGGGGGSDEPKGTGTLEDPYNPAGAADAVKDLTWTSNTEYEKTGPVYVKGKISKIADNGTYTQSGTFGNATFYMTEDGESGTEFYAYRILYLGNKKYTSGDDIKVGDEVIVYGEIMNYRGNTPETVQGTAYLYSLNGNTGGDSPTPGGDGEPAGTGTSEDPYNVAAARNLVKDYTWTSNTEYDKSEVVYVKGIISKIADNGTYSQSGTFGNALFYISDDGKDANNLYAYRILYLGNEKYTSGTDIKVGDEVVICGKLMNYRGNTPETVANEAYLYKLSEGGDTPTPGGNGSGTLADPYTPKGAIDAVKDLTWTSNTDYQSTEEVYVKGKISRIASGGTYTEGGTFGNASFYISADGTETDEFYAFRILYLGNKKFESGQTDIKVGDEVVIYGKLMNYRNNTPETEANKAYLYSLNGNTGGDTPEPPTPGDITTATIAEIKAAPVDNSKLYKLTATIKTIKNATYGNLIVTDATGELDIQGLIKGTAVGANDKSFPDLKLAEGDKITIVGVRQEFNGTPQLGSNNLACYFVSKEDGGDPTPGGNGSGTLDDPYTPKGAIDAVKDLTWTSNTDYQSTDNVYVKGKISRIASGGTYTEGGTYGNASFYISADGTETDEFYAFRILYLENKKFEEGQTDIKVGDEVVIYGKLMNYRGNTPETVSGNAYLYSLNGSTTPGGGGDTPTGGSVSFDTNNSAETWGEETDGTYGVGFSATTQGVKIGYYKHTGGTALVAPNAEHFRIYKNSVVVFTAPEGKKFKTIKMVAPAANNCLEMTGLEGGSNSTADTTTLTMTWTGSAAKVVLHAVNGQVRCKSVTIEFE